MVFSLCSLTICFGWLGRVKMFQRQSRVHHRCFNLTIVDHGELLRLLIVHYGKEMFVCLCVLLDCLLNELPVYLPVYLSIICIYLTACLPASRLLSIDLPVPFVPCIPCTVFSCVDYNQIQPSIHKRFDAFQILPCVL